MSGALKRDEWETVRLEDVCDKVERVSPKSFSEIYYVDISSIDRHSKSVSSPQRIRFETAPASARQLLKKTDILISTVRPNLNAVAIHETDSDIPTIGSTALCVLRCCDTISFRYVFHFTQSDYFIKPLVNVATGACYPTVKNRDVLNVEIPLPPLDIQRRIAETLDKVTELITLRKTQLEKLDELVKARFVEMFGDPEHNEKGWDIKKLEKLCVVGSSKRIYQSEQSVSGVSFLRISNLVNLIDTGIKDSDLYIPRELFLKLKEQGLVPTAGDILITARGTLGKCYIVKVDDEFYFQDGMISWLSKLDKVINAVYLTYLFSQYGFRKQIDSLQAGSTVAYLSIAQTKKLDIMLPPLDLQTQFASFVSSVEEAKAPIQQSLDALETLKKSLMQEYFG